MKKPITKEIDRSVDVNDSSDAIRLASLYSIYRGLLLSVRKPSKEAGSLSSVLIINPVTNTILHSSLLSSLIVSLPLSLSSHPRHFIFFQRVCHIGSDLLFFCQHPHGVVFSSMTSLHPSFPLVSLFQLLLWMQMRMFSTSARSVATSLSANLFSTQRLA